MIQWYSIHVCDFVKGFLGIIYVSIYRLRAVSFFLVCQVKCADMQMTTHVTEGVRPETSQRSRVHTPQLSAGSTRWMSFKTVELTLTQTPA